MLRLIDAAGLGPSTLEWSYLPSQFVHDRIVMSLEHRATGCSFLFDVDETGTHCYTFDLPRERAPRRGRVSRWSQQLRKVEEWLEATDRSGDAAALQSPTRLTRAPTEPPPETRDTITRKDWILLAMGVFAAKLADVVLPPAVIDDIRDATRLLIEGVSRSLRSALVAARSLGERM